MSLEARTWHAATPGWMERMTVICAVDPGHRTLEAIREVFADVEVELYLGGILFLAAAVKR